MTDIDYMIAVMQAAKEGKEIQGRSRTHLNFGAVWTNMTSPLWNWGMIDYRVKPAEPRRVWVNMYCNRMGFAHASREQADANAGDVSTECVEFVEVIRD